jgi:predicted nucleotide-binding protein
MLTKATFAFLLMTAEDEHADGRSHARENVIHEAGLFQGKLGLRKAILLFEDECEKPSNVHRLTCIGFPKHRIAAIFRGRPAGTLRASWCHSNLTNRVAIRENGLALESLPERISCE